MNGTNPPPPPPVEEVPHTAAARHALNKIATATPVQSSKPYLDPKIVLAQKRDRDQLIKLSTAPVNPANDALIIKYAAQHASNAGSLAYEPFGPLPSKVQDSISGAKKRKDQKAEIEADWNKSKTKQFSPELKSAWEKFKTATTQSSVDPAKWLDPDIGKAQQKYTTVLNQLSKSSSVSVAPANDANLVANATSYTGMGFSLSDLKSSVHDAIDSAQKRANLKKKIEANMATIDSSLKTDLVTYDSTKTDIIDNWDDFFATSDKIQPTDATQWGFSPQVISFCIGKKKDDGTRGVPLYKSLSNTVTYSSVQPSDKITKSVSSAAQGSWNTDTPGAIAGSCQYLGSIDADNCPSGSTIMYDTDGEMKTKSCGAYHSKAPMCTNADPRLCYVFGDDNEVLMRPAEKPTIQNNQGMFDCVYDIKDAKSVEVADAFRKKYSGDPRRDYDRMMEHICTAKVTDGCPEDKTECSKIKADSKCAQWFSALPRIAKSGAFDKISQQAVKTAICSGDSELKDSEECACWNRALMPEYSKTAKAYEETVGTVPDRCWYKPCKSDYAWKTEDMIGDNTNTQCPNVCTNLVKLNSKQVPIELNNVYLQCTQTQTTTSSKDGSKTKTVKTKKTTTKTPKTSKSSNLHHHNQNVLIIGIIVAVISLLIIAYYTYDH